MTTTRKTIKVQDFAHDINGKLVLDTIGSDEKRLLCHLAEYWLMETGNYHGFAYVGEDGKFLHPEQVRQGGEGFDEHRRVYFLR